MYFLNSAQFFGAGTLPTGMSTPVKWSKCSYVPQEPTIKFGAWDLIEAELLTSFLPMYLVNLAWFLCASTLPIGVSTPPKWSRNVHLCLRNLQNNFFAWDPNRSWDIDLPTPPCISSTQPSFSVLALCPQVCQHLSSGLICSYVPQEPTIKFDAWGPNRNCVLTSPPQCISSTWPSLGAPALYP